ncbi:MULTISPECIES: DUF2612 domain-containing protein [Acetobacter]|uniref:Burkholderia phage Bcep781 gp32 n=1 Tax=Acetobacter lovaniensis TaxID=104100 RepID=A0A841QID8_9PROT|nr:DUF2612 domain-containing protein [Acetobacter lovaniensis]MBB6457913.1 hypothetical protein [Acetobacter lovaniensis]NHN82173.1 DUF2612 domain-containing protein [Acetobacter lovaniensis]GBQ66186.1 hypothetical protein AA0474_1044 [Acetobacter lovaniensis NRIC 0474]
MQDVSQTILSQYANSPALCSFIEAWNQMLDPSAMINDWYNLVWNVQTAQGYGLDVWGRIVGVSRILSITSVKYLGWREANDLTEDSFNQAPWYRGVDATSNYRLSDDGYRQLIYAKALANISDGSILSLNRILTTLFAGQGDAYVHDGADMSMTYVFKFVPTDVQVSIIQNSGVLPRPAGVSVSYSIQSD